MPSHLAFPLLTPAMALLLGLSAGGGCFAQQAGTAPAPLNGSPFYTLHVYEDLVQVTALVLNRLRQPDSGMVSADFDLQLDAGPVFHPRLVRPEGDDPISVALLVDVSWPGAAAFVNLLPNALEHLPSDALHTTDHVSAYAFDCNLLVAARALPAQPTAITQAMARVLQQPSLHLDTAGGRCTRHVGLWDALTVVGQQQESTRERRVILLLSPGALAGSRNSPEAVRLALAGQGISVFGAVPRMVALPSAQQSRESALDALSAGTGGLSSIVAPEVLGRWLANTLALIRSRYVLEFSRPRNESAGLHQLDVSTRRREDRVFIGGALVPLRDPKLAADPTTVPHTLQNDPVVGTRKLLKPQ